MLSDDLHPFFRRDLPRQSSYGVEIPSMYSTQRSYAARHIARKARYQCSLRMYLRSYKYKLQTTILFLYNP